MGAKMMSKHEFLKSGEGSLANYNWTDLADGSGKIAFYLYTAIDSGGAYYGLTNQVIEVRGPPTSPYWVFSSLTSFDTSPFNVPRVVQGIMNFCGQLSIGGSVARSISCTAYKVSGAVETEIGAVLTSDSYSAPSSPLFNLSWNVPLTGFKIGDFIRIKVQVSGANAQINIDPTGTQLPSIRPAKLIVPFKIDV